MQCIPGLPYHVTGSLVLLLLPRLAGQPQRRRLSEAGLQRGRHVAPTCSDKGQILFGYISIFRLSHYQYRYSILPFGNVYVDHGLLFSVIMFSHLKITSRTELPAFQIASAIQDCLAYISSPLVVSRLTGIAPLSVKAELLTLLNQRQFEILLA